MSIIMNKRIKAISSVLLIILLAIRLCGCANDTYTPTKTVLATVLSAYPDIPDVRVCYSDAAESDEYYLDRDLLLSIFGTGEEIPEYDFVEECAFFIAKGQIVTEFAVFRSYTYASTEKIVQMCQRRLDNIKKSGAENTGEIITVGKYVILTVLPDNSKAKSIAGRMLS